MSNGVDGATVNYGWTLPAVHGSSSTWGDKLNSDLVQIDAQVFKNAQAALNGGSNVGDIKMFAGQTPPANWANCDGSSQSTTGAFAALFAVIGYRFGGSGANFNLPNMQSRFPLGMGPSQSVGQIGGGYSYAIGVANLPPHAHAIVDVAHNHGINQSPHSHGDAGHTHVVNDPQHSHGIPGSMGYGVGAISPPNVLNSGGGPMATSPSGTGISLQASNVGVEPQIANISLNASGTGLSTTQNTGSGTPLSIVPSYTTVNFIIRFQ